MERSSNTHFFGLQKKQAILESALFPGKNPGEDRFYRCDVIFGSPSDDCRGTGICKIVATRAQLHQGPVARSRDCKSTVALAIRPEGSTGLSLLLFREFLCVELVRHHFHHGVLAMAEPCPLPDSLVRHFNFSFRRLPSGIYKIEEKLGYYQIHFPIPASSK